METIKCRSIPTHKSKLAKTFQKVINLKTATKIASNNGIGICMLTSQNKFDQEHDLNKPYKPHDAKDKKKAVLYALAAKLFAGITAIKAAYAELQMAQNPYSSEAIQSADQAVVEELKSISQLKRSFFKNDLDHLSPQVTVMLAEIQEQQSMMKTYEITIKKLESEKKAKDLEASSLKKKLAESNLYNKSLEKTLNASGPLSMFDQVQFLNLNPTHFVQFLHSALRSMRAFVKIMVREMEFARWDIQAAANAIEPDLTFSNPTHCRFAFESFVSKTLFEGFNQPNFMLSNETHHYQNYFNKFKNLKSTNLRHYLTQNPTSSFSRFTRGKYLQLVHAKMECSLFGNLNQRKLVNSGGFPESAFFTAFLEMARRVWCLNLLAFSFGEDVSVFQVSKNSRFSEVYMESVTHESLLDDNDDGVEGDLRVGFTVVPGFKIGKTVVQSQVYLSPVSSPVSS
ncbi:protein GRAVITROPIC IN THE LIGHT 1 [Mercurialis annua]|uniref:protein GRAVITROPIC IN THE LIGHT 1 n=1 Tax=Mercurialis annua TaxID=3986 RepID=UPI0021600CBE|nr:protein GRAVITROPIC IN THE LIGHT 1 [Mercurialis annua]